MLQRYRKAIRSPSQFSELAIVGTFPLQSRTNGLHITKSRYGEAWNSLIRARCATLCDGQPLTQCDHSRVTIGGCGGQPWVPHRCDSVESRLPTEILTTRFSLDRYRERSPARDSQSIGGIHDMWVAYMTSPDQAGGGPLVPAMMPVITPAIKWRRSTQTL